ncbi:MAG: hypothetical protein AVDCRST_MAG93-7369 [uncultured Chloroflexia bacterium]|uniref:Uncharacterized protein n=1 Tax=uncultured Chloroflexia bacterium TaxID=1672391 RepID=A0A6J4MF04_9CHLR|nr:MAG: hypothetical protein AVDCRST_MAG93-7369 [uncultured Chloroflexia bacterium]
MRRHTIIYVVCILAIVGLAATPVAAQPERCFAETGYCISGRFLNYWEQNGGLAVFGYPTTRASNEVNPDTGRTYLTQWFERNRFELHPENAAPYDVLLGRLGDDRLQQLGVDWHQFPSGPAEESCVYFGPTRHNLCDTLYSAGQCVGGCPIGFRQYWATHGLEFDGRPGTSFEESVALFGMPLSSAYIDQDESGSRQVVQWFERARFEWHPRNPDEFTVLLGLLAVEVRGEASMSMSVHKATTRNSVSIR